MASHRIQKINDQLRAEISDLISREMKDPRLRGLISITEVETAPDLSRARVFVSILGSEEDRVETLNTLRRATGFFRHELRERLRMKRTPELDVRLDTSIERGAQIMQLLRNVQTASEGVKQPDDADAGSAAGAVSRPDGEAED